MPNFGNANATETVGPTQADEGNIDVLLTLLGEGGTRGCICAEQINGVHKALLRIHTDYAKQFRDFFFSMNGVKTEDNVKKLQALFEELCKEANDDNAWAILDKSPIFTTKRALKLCKEIEVEINKLHPTNMSHEEASKNALLIIARRMIADGRLQGTLTTHTEENATKMRDTVNNALLGYNQRRMGKRIKEANQEKKTHLIGWLKLILALIVLLFFLGEIYTASTAPVPKNDTVNPLAPLEHKLSQGIEKTYQSITQEQGE
jgi:hypothetical protein